jgi:hypothetical protein
MNDALYDLYYRSVRHNGDAEQSSAEPAGNSIAAKTLDDVIAGLKRTESKKCHKFKFTDIRYDMLPILDNTNRVVSFYPEPYIAYNDEKLDISTYKNAFKNFDINSLPLIRAAYKLGIKVEKAETYDDYGHYSPVENKIVIGNTDKSKNQSN